MKFKLFMISAFLFSQGLFAQNRVISTPNTTLVINAEKGKIPYFVYYGDKLSDQDLQSIDFAQSRVSLFPVYGNNAPVESALSVIHSDGNMTTEMVVESVTVENQGNSQLTRIYLKDSYYPFYLTLCYRAYNDVDMIECFTEISHSEKKDVVLTQYDSFMLPIRRGNTWISRLTGTWADEGQLIQEPINDGLIEIKNLDGVRNSHTTHSEVMFSLDGKPSENNGRTIGAALCWSGNYSLRVHTGDTDFHRFFAGICSEHSQYYLKKGEVFITPSLALTYSDEGLSGVSRNFHSWARKYKIANAQTDRKILLNSWEGVYFNINQQGMDNMMSDIASMGGELFVMDDGWFGNKYQRNSDNCALGDWNTDTIKLPAGIDGLISAANKNGIDFGIWIEPEMSNTVSELYEKHHDWVIKAANRDVVTGRGGTQVVLDLSNPKVRDFVFSIVDNLMTKYPKIKYIKWDANMSIMEQGSQYLPADRQSHLYIAYHRGFEEVCKRIRNKYPEVTIQACASGGGRANYGVLPYFDEFWVSDNTDALQRVYMQWGTSYFFPAIAMASHISAAPNHQTFRVIPLKYRIDVAMSGRLGMEIQPRNMSTDEKDLCKRAIADYKTIRPVVQHGNIYRLISPFDKLGVASLMYVDDNKDKAVFYWWKTETFINQRIPRVTMAGLDKNKLYTVKELNRIDNQPLSFEGKQFTGEYLMKNGLEIPYSHIVDYNKLTAWSSRVIYLTAQ